MLERFFLRLHIYLTNLKDCVISLLRDKSASAKIPKCILDELARCFLPDIIAFYETPEGREEYENGSLPSAAYAPERPAAPLKAKIRGGLTISPPWNFTSDINNKSEPFTNW